MASGIPGRASNKTKQATRASSWKNGQERKTRRVEQQHANEVHNRALRAQGKLTSWEEACALRAERRVAAGCRARWEASRKREQIPSTVGGG